MRRTYLMFIFVAIGFLVGVAGCGRADSDTDRLHAESVFDCCSIGFVLIGVVLGLVIAKSFYDALRDKFDAQLEVNKKLKSESTSLRARMTAISPIAAGDHLIVSLPVDGRVCDTEVCVHKSGTIEVPSLGTINVLDIPGHQLGNYLTTLLCELTALRNACLKAKEEGLVSVLAEAREQFDKQLARLVADVPKPADWQQLHDQYRTNHLRAARHGRLVSVVAHGDPSGATQIDWKIMRPPPSPFHVTIMEDGVTIASEWAHAGRVNRFVTPGRDHTFSFLIQDDTREKAPNLEPSFQFVVSAPTIEQWTWREAGGDEGTRILKNIKDRVTDIRNAEQEIDGLGLSEEEAKWAKAQFAARRMKTNLPE